MGRSWTKWVYDKRLKSLSAGNLISFESDCAISDCQIRLRFHTEHRKDIRWCGIFITPKKGREHSLYPVFEFRRIVLQPKNRPGQEEGLADIVQQACRHILDGDDLIRNKCNATHDKQHCTSILRDFETIRFHNILHFIFTTKVWWLCSHHGGTTVSAQNRADDIPCYLQNPFPSVTHNFSLSFFWTQLRATLCTFRSENLTNLTNLFYTLRVEILKNLFKNLCRYAPEILCSNLYFCDFFDLKVRSVALQSMPGSRDTLWKFLWFLWFLCDPLKSAGAAKFLPFLQFLRPKGTKCGVAFCGTSILLAQQIFNFLIDLGRFVPSGQRIFNFQFSIVNCQFWSAPAVGSSGSTPPSPESPLPEVPEVLLPEPLVPEPLPEVPEVLLELEPELPVVLVLSSSLSSTVPASAEVTRFTSSPLRS